MSQSTAAKVLRRKNTLSAYLLLTLKMAQMGIMSAMEYRASFFMQIIGMLINDSAFIILWLIFFEKFPSLNGWTFRDTALLFSITAINYALVMLLAKGSTQLAKIIASGELDHHLSFPKNILWSVSTSRTDISAIGDLIFGITIFFFSGDISLEKTAWLIAVSAISAVIFFNFIVITQSLAFYFGNFESAAESLLDALLGFTLYPQSVFEGIIKIVTMTMLPAFFIATLPVQLIKNFNIDFLLELLIFCLITSWLAITVFKRGLTRYESGNLINIRL